MRKYTIAALVLCALASAAPAQADMAEAQQAYANGDFARAVELWQEEATNGNADAAWYVGNMFVDGLGVDYPDPILATIYYQMAADRGNVEGMVSLGLMYNQGRGVDQDYRRGIDLLYQAGLEGHPVAQVELANLFMTGVQDQVQRSLPHAFEWYGLAARQGIVLAQLRFGQMYFDGVGVPQDQEEGLMWLGVAQAVANASDEPYWSYRVFPLDAEIIPDDEDDPMTTLRNAVIEVYQDHAAQVSTETAYEAMNASRAWIAERAD